MTDLNAALSGTFAIGGDLKVNRLGFGAMRITGKGIWGPPEDHLETLLETIGPARFVFGTGQPLRIPENAIAKLDLLDLPAGARADIESGNASLLRSTPST